MIKYILLLSIFLTTVYAQVDISAQIAQLKGAKKSEKYMIMNKIKMQISRLNSTQRAKAIAQLRGATSNTGSTVRSPQIVRTLPTHLQDLPQIPVLPAPQIPVSMPGVLVPQLPGQSVPQLPGQLVPQIPVPSVPQVPVPSVPQVPVPSVPEVPGTIPNPLPPVTIPSSSQHISTGGQ